MAYNQLAVTYTKMRQYNSSYHLITIYYYILSLSVYKQPVSYQKNNNLKQAILYIRKYIHIYPNDDCICNTLAQFDYYLLYLYDLLLHYSYPLEKKDDELYRLQLFQQGEIKQIEMMDQTQANRLQKSIKTLIYSLLNMLRVHHYTDLYKKDINKRLEVIKFSLCYLINNIYIITLLATQIKKQKASSEASESRSNGATASRASEANATSGAAAYQTNDFLKIRFQYALTLIMEYITLLMEMTDVKNIYLLSTITVFLEWWYYTRTFLKKFVATSILNTFYQQLVHLLNRISPYFYQKQIEIEKILNKLVAISLKEELIVYNLKFFQIETNKRLHIDSLKQSNFFVILKKKKKILMKNQKKKKKFQKKKKISIKMIKLKRFLKLYTFAYKLSQEKLIFYKWNNDYPLWINKSDDMFQEVQEESNSFHLKKLIYSHHNISWLHNNTHSTNISRKSAMLYDHDYINQNDDHLIVFTEPLTQPTHNPKLYMNYNQQQQQQQQQIDDEYDQHDDQMLFDPNDDLCDDIEGMFFE